MNITFESANDELIRFINKLLSRRLSQTNSPVIKSMKISGEEKIKIIKVMPLHVVDLEDESFKTEKHATQFLALFGTASRVLGLVEVNRGSSDTSAYEEGRFGGAQLAQGVMSALGQIYSQEGPPVSARLCVSYFPKLHFFTLVHGQTKDIVPILPMDNKLRHGHVYSVKDFMSLMTIPEHGPEPLFG